MDKEIESMHDLDLKMDELDYGEEMEYGEDDDLLIYDTDEIEKPLTIRVPFSANLRAYPHHESKLVKRIRKDKEMEVIDIVSGSLIALTNIWYEVDGGFVHASQVEVV